MLTRTFQLCLPHKHAFSVSFVFRGKHTNEEKSLDVFQNIPKFGNLNTNPLEHKQSVDDRRPKRDGKTLNVAILGIPNSGKSTLVNRLVGKQVCPSSCKTHTTRYTARGIFTKDDTQIVFLDTPGVVDSKDAEKFNLEKTLVKGPEISCSEADVLLVMHDLSNRFVRESIDKNILRLLCKSQHRVPSILVLNKLDAMPTKRNIYDLIRKLTCNRLDDNSTEVKISQHDPKWNVEAYLKRKKSIAKHAAEDETSSSTDNMSVSDVLTEAARDRVSEERAEVLIKGMIGWPGFRDVFSISAKDGNGVDDLKQYLMDIAKPGGHRFSSELFMDMDPRTCVLNMIKSKLLEHLKHDIPYKLDPLLENWEHNEAKQVLHISASLTVSTRREMSSLIGPRGKTIRRICTDIEATLTDFFDYTVKVHLSTNQINVEQRKRTLF